MGVTATHYFKLDGNSENHPQEGVIGMDFDELIFDSELAKLAINYDKFFFASAVGQNLIIKAKTDSQYISMSRVESVEEFLIDQASDASET